MSKFWRRLVLLSTDVVATTLVMGLTFLIRFASDGRAIPSERPETVECGPNILASCDPDAILRADGFVTTVGSGTWWAIPPTAAMLAKTMGTDNWSGLTTALLGQAPLEECLKETAVPNLVVLPSGPIPPNPAELLGSNRMASLLGELEERLNMVLVDTPPVLAVTDAAVLAPKVGGVVLVVRSGQTQRAQVVRAKEGLEAVKARILGVMLDAVQAEGRDGYDYYYYQSEGGRPSAR